MVLSGGGGRFLGQTAESCGTVTERTGQTTEELLVIRNSSEQRAILSRCTAMSETVS